MVARNYSSRLIIGRETRFKGLSLSGGIALGSVCLFDSHRHNRLPIFRLMDDDQVAQEKERLAEAIQVAAERIDTLYDEVHERIGLSEAEIFTAQKAILLDPSLKERTESAIENDRVNAEAAASEVLNSYIERLMAVENEYVRERAADIREIRMRLLDAFRRRAPQRECRTGNECEHLSLRVLVANELTPGMTVDLTPGQVLGFVTEQGGRNSHAAILARALGIPAVSGIKGIHERLPCGTEILVDGDQGEVIIWPTHETLSALQCELNVAPRTPEVVPPIDGLVTMANISLVSEIVDAIHAQAEGIGLYRTEFEFLAQGRRLSEDEQFERYSQVLETMAGKPVYFRLLDIGGDKPAPFLDIPHEPNPNLGYRGGRLLQGHPELLRDQARALARASAQGTVVYVMYPMIVDCDQFVALRQQFLEAVADIPNHDLRHGPMFEVPAICFQAREVLEEADFASIGANDLTQYLFAVDRDNALVAYDYNPDRPAFWKAIRLIVEAAEATGCPLSVCGEIAGETNMLAKLRAIGIRSISVSPRLIAPLRSHVLNGDV